MSSTQISVKEYKIATTFIGPKTGEEYCLSSGSAMSLDWAEEAVEPERVLKTIEITRSGLMAGHPIQINSHNSTRTMGCWKTLVYREPNPENPGEGDLTAETVIGLARSLPASQREMVVRALTRAPFTAPFPGAGRGLPIQRLAPGSRPGSQGPTGPKKPKGAPPPCNPFISQEERDAKKAFRDAKAAREKYAIANRVPVGPSARADDPIWIGLSTEIQERLLVLDERVNITSAESSRLAKVRRIEEGKAQANPGISPLGGPIAPRTGATASPPDPPPAVEKTLAEAKAQLAAREAKQRNKTLPPGRGTKK